MVPAGNKTKRLLSVNHTTKTIHHSSSSFLFNFSTRLKSFFSEMVLKRDFGFCILKHLDRITKRK